MKINEVMTKAVQICGMDTSLEAATLMMWDNDCGCVPVVDERSKPIAIVTDRDVAIGAALQHKPLWELRVSDITAGHPLFCCKASDDVHGALELMREHGVRRLPVLQANGKLAGIVSMGDILAKADTKATASTLPLKDTLNMLKTVTGHHSEIVRVA